MSEEVLTLCIALMTTGNQVFMLLGPCRTYRAHGFLEIKHLLQTGSGMLGRAISLDCTGLWDEVKTSSGAPAIYFTLGKRNLFNGRFSEFEKRFNSPATGVPENRQNLAAN